MPLFVWKCRVLIGYCLSGTFDRMRTFARNQTLRTGQNRTAIDRMRFANVRVRNSNKRSHANCELRIANEVEMGLKDEMNFIMGDINCKVGKVMCERVEESC